MHGEDQTLESSFAISGQDARRSHGVSDRGGARRGQGAQEQSAARPDASRRKARVPQGPRRACACLASSASSYSSCTESFPSPSSLARCSSSRGLGARDQGARKIAPIATVENLYDISERKYEDVLEFCERVGIGFIPLVPGVYGPPSRAS